MRLSIVLSVALAAAPCMAQAQPAPRRADARPHVFVTLGAAEEPLEGSLLDLSAESVTLVTGGVEWRYPLDQVTRIQRLGDRSYDGAVRGALIGAVCILTSAQGARNDRHLRQLVFTNVAVAAALGWVLDRVHVGRTTLYDQRAARARTSGR